MMYAIQHKVTGVLIDLCDTLEQAAAWEEKGFDIINTEKTSHLKVRYIEFSGPNGYGCNTPEFETYGGITRCFISLAKWVQRSCGIFGPDYREIRDYFRDCHLYVNGEDKSGWFHRVVNINKGKIFI